MQAYTHVLVGIWTERFVRRPTRRRWIQGAALAVIGAATHVLWDDLAGMTFHPRGLHAIYDPVAGIYSLIALGIAGVIAWRWREYALGMATALIPDLDWVFFRPLHWFGVAPWWEEGMCHEMLRQLPGIATCSAILSRLPDWRLQPFAAIPELFFASVLFALLLKMGRKNSTQ